MRNAMVGMLAAALVGCGGGEGAVDQAQVETRVAAWAAAVTTSDATRRDALAAVVTPDVTYVDASGVVEGLDALAARGALSWSTQGELAAHHDVARVNAVVGGEDSVVLFQTRGALFSTVVVMPAAAHGVDTTPAPVRAYQDAWNVRRNVPRLEKIEEGWRDAARYVDPQADVTGQDALNDHIAGYQRTFAPTTLRTTDFVERHGWVLFRWGITAPGGAVLVPGMDIGHRAADGRLDLIVGFF